MFEEIKCTKCGGPIEGLQLTEEQRRWLDMTKEAVIEHMKEIDKAFDSEMSIEEMTQANGWRAIAEPFLFLYGYMLSREERKQ